MPKASFGGTLADNHKNIFVPFERFVFKEESRVLLTGLIHQRVFQLNVWKNTLDIPVDDVNGCESLLTINHFVPSLPILPNHQRL